MSKNDKQSRQIRMFIYLRFLHAKEYKLLTHEKKGHLTDLKPKRISSQQQGKYKQIKIIIKQSPVYLFIFCLNFKGLIIFSFKEH